MSETDTEPAPIDWQTIELDYRSGTKALRQIAEEHSVTHAAIIKRAKRDDWGRDLTAKIRAKADALVTKAAVTKEVTNARLVTEKAAVEANATLQFQVRMAHRASLQRQCNARDDLAFRIEHDKSLDLPQRAEVIKKWVDIDEKVRKGQREAFNIGDDTGNDAPRTFTDVERAHRLSAWLERVQTRIAGETSDAEPVEP